MNLFKNRILKPISVILLSLILIFVGLLGIYDYIIPDTVSYFEGDGLPVFMYAEASAKNCDSGENAEYRLLGVVPIKTVKLTSYKDIKLVPGGMPFGVKFFTDGMIVADFCDVSTEQGKVNPAKNAGLKINDLITHIDGHPTAGTEDLSDAIDASGGKEITLTYTRGGVTHNVKLTPVKCTADGKYKTGIMIKDSGAGIGTVSFIEPESGLFGGLGHGICDVESGELIPMKRGAIVDVTISGVEKGISGTPGEIKGFFNRQKLGSMIKNSDCGVFGVFTEPLQNPLSEPLPIGLKSDIKEGDATIYCTLDDGEMKEYSIKISNVDKNAAHGKCFNVKVTDPELIEKTGGIIQGMSGSPIIQNGKLVGAVTHVLVNDPTRGYGIFIENMLNQINDMAS
ncbi:MAG: SpoIVB peptidase [Clostridia bacterium]|nr:SpoIVB peptidase [Clostridia bacterium]